MSSSNRCFLAFIQISQEAGYVAWYSHFFLNFPQFIVIHIVKGFDIVNKAELYVFLELSCFFDDPGMLAIWSLVPLPFLKPAWTSGSSRFTYCWSLAWRTLSITFSLSCDFPGGSDGKRLSTMQETQVRFTCMHGRRKWQPTPVFLPGESQGCGSLVGCHLWGLTESDTTEAT